MLQAGEVLHNRYEIVKMVGQGGMSTVYQARDMETRQLLALKDVKRSCTAQNQVVEQSLAAEGRMLKQLSNPHLPRIYEIIEEQEKIVLVMDFIQGESLDKVIAREGAQSVERVLDWGMQICEVFHYLHNQPTPIIYRDMKPANVMLQPNGKLMMIDFGTARTQKVGVQMQADTICIGTAGFAAPEQFGGIGQSTARTDIFCLGATLYNMITGHSPCDRPIGILPLEQWNPALADTPIAEIIAKCTRNDPDERYQSAMELHEALRLASIGAYQMAGKRGKSFGGFWQQQDMKGKGLVGGGLSGLLQLGKPGNSGVIGNRDAGSSAGQQGAAQSSTGSSGSGWQTADTKGMLQGQITQEIAQQQDGKEELLRKLVLIAVLVAIIFVVLTVVLALLQVLGAAVIFLLIALASAIAGVVGMIMLHR